MLGLPSLLPGGLLLLRLQGEGADLLEPLHLVLRHSPGCVWDGRWPWPSRGRLVYRALWLVHTLTGEVGLGCLEAPELELHLVEGLRVAPVPQLAPSLVVCDLVPHRLGREVLRLLDDLELSALLYLGLLELLDPLAEGLMLWIIAWADHHLTNRDGCQVRHLLDSFLASLLLLLVGRGWRYPVCSLEGACGALYLLAISWWLLGLSHLGPRLCLPGSDLRLRQEIRRSPDGVRYSVRCLLLMGRLGCLLRLGHPLLLAHLEVVLLVLPAHRAARPLGRVHLLPLRVLAFS